ncbi:hypothetical protein HTIA_0114 [Halorhabdus tiamatea SARL4B]|uniref:Uncharacterized protein n=1 Tax=Halorhabdus tiamatea SARL4B TaxID=1033806 RepID=S6D1A1_9EURY|nr:hypothetical protein HTIA_0114 [Halorhabdus tiamatea SARL4B]
MRGVSNNHEAPNHQERDEDEQRATEHETGTETCSAADNHTCARDAGPSDPVGEGTSDERADTSHCNRSEREQGSECGCWLAPSRETRSQIHRNPRPNGIQFPHVPEVPDVCEHRPAVAEHPPNGTGIERRCRCLVGAWPYQEHEHTTDRCKHARTQEDGTRAADAPDRSKQMRQCRSDCQCTDERADGKPETILKPARHDFHPSRIHTGQCDTSQQSQKYRGKERRHRKCNNRRRSGTDGSRDCKEIPRRNRIREGERRGQDGTEDEAELHCVGQPRCLGARQIPGRFEFRADCRHTEPERHRQEFGDSDDEEDPVSAEVHPFPLQRWPRISVVSVCIVDYTCSSDTSPDYMIHDHVNLDYGSGGSTIRGAINPSR